MRGDRSRALPTILTCGLLCGCGPASDGTGASTSEGDSEDGTASTSAGSETAETGATTEPVGDVTDDSSWIGECGNGQQEPAEECDDGNDDNLDGCTEYCTLPSCDDGLHTEGETDVDCGGVCSQVCLDEQGCAVDEDCASSLCADGVCVTEPSCAGLLARLPGLGSGVYPVDPDGDNGPINRYDVYCDMGDDPEAPVDGGGWTLVLAVVDDGAATFTWSDRDRLTSVDPSPVGSVLEFEESDFKSPAYHQLGFTDLMFKHQPSGVYAVYKDIGNGAMYPANFVGAQPSPNCDAGSGYPLSEGPAILASPNLGNLCDTNLYFHCGDYDGATQAECEANAGADQAPTFGPCWSRVGDDGCPFDDPSYAGIGPVFGADPATHELEERGFGFGEALGLNPEEPGEQPTSLQMYIR